MATNQACRNETIAHIASVAAKAVVQAMLAERGDGDELTRCRSEEAGMRTKRGRPSPAIKEKPEKMYQRIC